MVLVSVRLPEVHSVCVLASVQLPMCVCVVVSVQLPEVHDACVLVSVRLRYTCVCVGVCIFVMHGSM